MDYSYLFNTATGSRWQKIGINRKAGVAVPLFSVYSKNSIGIGEVPDIKLLIDWCRMNGFSVLQLLPLNEVGIDNAPYNAISTFAIEPIYINLNTIKGIALNLFIADISRIKNRFPLRKIRVNYRVRQAKLDLLWKMYQSISFSDQLFIEYCKTNSYWLNDYALFKVIQEISGEPEWVNWPEELKNHNIDEITKIEIENKERLCFHKWLQWQLYEQLKDVRTYAETQCILVMGDLPFLVSRNSADVWAHQNYFRLESSAGAPPDMYFALGQKWGMPPYNWYEIAAHGFDYLRERLKYSENFYDMFRIDHFVGLFRLWTLPVSAPPEEAASQGRYEPYEEHLWEEHGKAIINIILEGTSMMPCAEDLGTVPPCSYKVLRDYGIPGIDFQRYLKSQENNFGFKKPYEYRDNSIAVTSTHDSSFFFNWWEHEAGTMDEKLFEILCEKKGLNLQQISEFEKLLFNKKLSGHGRVYWNDAINSRELFLSIVQPAYETENNLSYAYLDSYGEKWKFLDYLECHEIPLDESNTKLVYKCLEKINMSSSIFSIQLLQEYLALDSSLLKKMNRWSYRINMPGTVSNKNWSQLLPCSLEEMMDLEINNSIKGILQNSGRV